MHDLDRTQMEYESMNEFEDDYEYDDEGWGEESQVFSPEDEARLANDLLTVETEEELDYFLKGLLSSVGKVLKSPVAKALGGALKSAAKAALPAVGGALGSVVPGVGTAIGTTLGTAASRLFEAEGDYSGELEFEGAKRFVRMTGTAIQQASNAPRQANPRAVARQAVTVAAKQHAPELLRPMTSAKLDDTAQTGRWVRRGNRIVLFGV